MTSTQHYDVLIVGAGVSGIGLACHLARECPDKTIAILERRSDIGGTWDLFRYPGIRSDSDMYTFGYAFRPWTEPKILADGPSIKQYVRETAREHDVERCIHHGLDVRKATWSSDQARWTVSAKDIASQEQRDYSCNFLLGATGYYRYDAGYTPDFPGQSSFQGTIVHPQHWPENLDYAGKRVVVIGSGATAITLIPSMADDTAHITMLQRSPSFIASLPAKDKLSQQLYKVLPEQWVYNLSRARNIALQNLMYKACQRWPKQSRWLLQKGIRRQVGSQVDMRNFDPDYDPWDQRLCVVPNGDLFKTLRRGKASIVTDQIESFTETGIRLASGEHLEADIIVTATGLDVQVLGNMELQVDGEPVDASDRLMYKSTLLEGVPNAAIVIGYVNASWTLKVDLVGDYLGRLLNYMSAHGYDQVVARDREGCKSDSSMMDALQSGYIQRASDRLPRQGSKPPWQVTNDYLADRPMLAKAPIVDGILEFSAFAGGAVRDRSKSQAA